jgi:hypothetical protein
MQSNQTGTIEAQAEDPTISLSLQKIISESFENLETKLISQKTKSENEKTPLNWQEMDSVTTRFQGDQEFSSLSECIALKVSDSVSSFFQEMFRTQEQEEKSESLPPCTGVVGLKKGLRGKAAGNLEEIPESESFCPSSNETHRKQIELDTADSISKNANKEKREEPVCEGTLDQPEEEERLKDEPVNNQQKKGKDKKIAIGNQKSLLEETGLMRHKNGDSVELGEFETESDQVAGNQESHSTQKEKKRKIPKRKAKKHLRSQEVTKDCYSLPINTRSTVILQKKKDERPAETKSQWLKAKKNEFFFDFNFRAPFQIEKIPLSKLSSTIKCHSRGDSINNRTTFKENMKLRGSIAKNPNGVFQKATSPRQTILSSGFALEPTPVEGETRNKEVLGKHFRMTPKKKGKKSESGEKIAKPKGKGPDKTKKSHSKIKKESQKEINPLFMTFQAESCLLEKPSGQKGEQLNEKKQNKKALLKQRPETRKKKVEKTSIGKQKNSLKGDVSQKNK